MTFESEWARCAPWLEAALRRSPDGYTLEAVLHEVWAHNATFWPGPDAAMVTERCGDEANVWVAGGSLSGLLRMAPIVEAGLKDRGFTAVTIMGRRGWDRALAPHGYCRDGDELRKVL